nr:putative reverse transcriptase, RNA-dependent DNA polymerase [Tanacetum cinerariifolium]
MAFLSAIDSHDELKNFQQALQDVKWQDTMKKEIRALQQNGTWTLEELPEGKKAIDSKWVYKIKYKPNGDIERYKFVADARQPHLDAALRVVHYLKTTLGQGILLPKQGGTQLISYCNFVWMGCPFTRRSRAGYLLMLGGALVSWKSKKQLVLSRSSAEAEYRTMAITVSKVLWFRWLLTELDAPQKGPTITYKFIYNRLFDYLILQVLGRARLGPDQSKPDRIKNRFCLESQTDYETEMFDLCPGPSRGVIWFGFVRPDRAAKKKITVALAEVEREHVADFIADELIKKQLSIVFLENVDMADILTRHHLYRAITIGIPS